MFYLFTPRKYLTLSQLLSLTESWRIDSRAAAVASSGLGRNISSHRRAGEGKAAASGGEHGVNDVACPVEVPSVDEVGAREDKPPRPAHRARRQWRLLGGQGRDQAMAASRHSGISRAATRRRRASGRWRPAGGLEVVPRCCWNFIKKFVQFVKMLLKFCRNSIKFRICANYYVSQCGSFKCPFDKNLTLLTSPSKTWAKSLFGLKSEGKNENTKKYG